MRWEYQVISFKDRSWMGGVIDENEAVAELNALGAHGWELVSSFDTNVGNGATRNYVFVFKRPIRGAAEPV